jgi:hypothetical protein
VPHPAAANVRIARTIALAQTMPDLVPACSGGDVCSMMGLGVNPVTASGEGDNNHVVLNPGTGRERVQGGGDNLLEAGEVLVNNTGGGGGYRDPFEREPGRVADDVRNGFVSVLSAERGYGVVIDGATLTVDEAATAARREVAR